MIPDEHLFWSYRLAKFEVTAEKRGVGRIAFAEYEQDLHQRLAKLRNDGISPDRIFRSIEPGQIWLRPKSVDRPPRRGNDGVMITIPEPAHDHQISGISTRVLLEPSPDFATSEVLWIRTFGPVLELMLSTHCQGNRLDVRGTPAAVPFGGLRLFRYWGRAYRRFRSEGISVARRLLKRGTGCILAVLDLTSYYDNIDPGFLLDVDFVDDLQALAEREEAPFDRVAYTDATAGLLGAYERIRVLTQAAVGTRAAIGIPIGALTSRIVANLALCELDNHLSAQSDIRHYARYVDDIIAVAESAADVRGSLEAIVTRFVPLDSAQSTRSTLVLDAAYFGRPGSRFEVQSGKLRVFQLGGEAGLEYLGSVESEMERLSSERRRFLAPRSAELDHTIAASPQAESIRVLRDADALTLRKYAISTMCDKVVVASAMLKRPDAAIFSRKYLGKAGRLATDWSRWIELIDVAMRILGAALVSGDAETVREVLFALLDRAKSLHQGGDRRKRIRVRWGKSKIDVRRARKLLRSWVEAQLFEVVCSAAPFDAEGFTIDGFEGFSKLFRVEPERQRSKRLLELTRLVAAADLRLHDYESDSVIGCPRPRRPTPTISALRGELSPDERVGPRAVIIAAFIAACREQGDGVYEHWTPVDVLLSPTPPSYVDIMFRWMRGGRPISALSEAVNAVRGTRYLRSTMIVDEGGITAQPPEEWYASGTPSQTRVVLANLCTDVSWWLASLKDPEHSAERQDRLSRVVNQAMDISRRSRMKQMATLLLLPELSLPRQWAREVFRHVGYNAPELSIVGGLEYDVQGRQVYNEAIAFLPRPYLSAAGWVWSKRRPAHREAIELAANGGYSLAARNENERFRVMTSEHGAFLPLICSELLEVDSRSRLLGKVDLVLVPAWNQDIGSFEYFIQSSPLELHAFVAVANNGIFSDCRARGPFSEPWRREACRLMSRGEDETVSAVFPIQRLREYRADAVNYDRARDGWIQDAEQAKRDVSLCPWPGWKPVPPGMVASQVAPSNGEDTE